MFFRFGFLIFLLTLGRHTAAQQNTPIYKGLRLSLFNVVVKKQKAENVSLRLDVVNTGRMPVTFEGQNSPASEQLVIELDTTNLPLPLQGRESLISGAVLNEKINLGPGEILRDLTLDIRLKPGELGIPVAAGSDSSHQTCPDLVFDTAYIAQYTDNAMLLHFFIRNTGNTPARLLGKSIDDEDNLAVNVYFVSGVKLTRGAIFAESIFIREGRETLDGLLLPEQVLQGEIEISLAKRTRFSPNLLLELDPFLTVEDCDRTNNTRAVEVAF